MDATQQQAADTMSETSSEPVVYYAAPSPMEVVGIVESNAGMFNESFLNPTSNAAKYTTGLKKSLNLGVYGSDLSYVAILNQTQKSRNYLTTVKSLSDQLGMSGAFEKSFLDQLETNIANRDSLIRVITEFYWNADSYLVENERSTTSTLMAVGGWVEGMYFATQMAKTAKDGKDKLVNHIAEQKLTLKNLVFLMRVKSSEQMDATDILSDLEALKAVFEQVSVTHNDGEVSTDEASATTKVGGTNTIQMTPDQLTDITGKIEALRNKIVQ